MASKAFAVVEAVDSPKGAMLVRYQIVERCEPDPEEKRIAEAEMEDHLKEMDEEVREQFRVQMAAATAMSPANKTTYNVEDKMVICQSPEEVVAAIKEAKESYDEIRKLQKAGTRLNTNLNWLRTF
jgi:pimeloyl-CoA synthetase